MDDGNGAMSGLMRALGTMLGVHIQYAQQEARGDVSRVLVGVAMLGAAVAVLSIALIFGQLAVVVALEQRTSLDLWRAIAVVASADMLLGLALLMLGRRRLRKPFLKETRSLVKRTAKSLVE